MQTLSDMICHPALAHGMRMQLQQYAGWAASLLDPCPANLDLSQAQWHRCHFLDIKQSSNLSRQTWKSADVVQVGDAAAAAREQPTWNLNDSNDWLRRQQVRMALFWMFFIAVVLWYETCVH